MEIRIKTQEEFHDTHVTIEIDRDGTYDAGAAAEVLAENYTRSRDEVLRLRGESEAHREEVIGLIRESDRLRVKIRELRRDADQAVVLRAKLEEVKSQAETFKSQAYTENERAAALTSHLEDTVHREQELRAAALKEKDREIVAVRANLVSAEMTVQFLRAQVARRDRRIAEIGKAVWVGAIADEILINYFDPKSPGQDLADAVRRVRELLSSPSEPTSQA